MSIWDGILVALFCMLVVFAVLIALWFVIKMISVFIRKIDKSDAKTKNS